MNMQFLLKVLMFTAQMLHDKCHYERYYIYYLHSFIYKKYVDIVKNDHLCCTSMLIYIIRTKQCNRRK